MTRRSSLTGPGTAVLPNTAFSEGPLWTTSGAGFKLGRKPLAVFQPTAHIGGGSGDQWMQQAGARTSSLEKMRRLCYMGTVTPVHFEHTGSGQGASGRPGRMRRVCAGTLVHYIIWAN